MRLKLCLTHISNPYSHMLIEQVKDEDNNEIDARCGNWGGQLWSKQRSNKLDPAGCAILHDASKSSINC